MSRELVQMLCNVVRAYRAMPIGPITPADAELVMPDWKRLAEDADHVLAAANGVLRLESAGSVQSTEPREPSSAAVAASRLIVARAVERRRIVKLRIAALEKAHNTGGDRVLTWKDYRDEYFAADKALDEAADAFIEAGAQQGTK